MLLQILTVSINQALRQDIQSQNQKLNIMLGDTINTLSAKGRLDGPKRDLALAATVYHLGKDNVLKVNHRASTVTVPRKKRQRKS